MANPLFQGKTIEVLDLGSGNFELTFDYKTESVNKVDSQTLADLKEGLAVLKKQSPKVHNLWALFVVSQSKTKGKFLPLRFRRWVVYLPLRRFRFYGFRTV